MTQTVLVPFNSIVSGTCFWHLRHIWKQGPRSMGVTIMADTEQLQITG